MPILGAGEVETEIQSGDLISQKLSTRGCYLANYAGFTHVYVKIYGENNIFPWLGNNKIKNDVL
jgi:hypothetical protein